MHGLPKFLFIVALSLPLVGCVTERTYSGTDIPVSERTLDKTSAAKERMQLGLTYLKRGNMEQAKFNLNRAVDYAPQLSAVHTAMAYYYQTVDDVVRAEESYRKAINTSDATGDAMNNFGVFLCQQDKFSQAEVMFKNAIEAKEYTRTASSYENLGVCSLSAGEPEKAKQYFESALRYDPRRQSTLMELIDLAIAESDYDAAKTNLQRFHRVAQQTPESLALGIKISRELADDEALQRYGITLIAKYPASEQAKEYRATLH
ncbi:type IV pilus biogenesis/stability protein PilW [Shewanella sp. 1_MG-2023]|jgi:type IV pilus assembly protein PilF|uniref:Type IV pilus biogenesis/stability protein PilW n=1 Tax=Shewanella electrodiphila TaxID=934143 RepID=A0ABT0KN14_9GAMM|nr:MULTISPECIES: type IV pilus biogenesis/stability protein PilW [Shewanella]MCC4834739.1 type IV pilus biogenesis/stability protein PilW [Shewanella sp. 10N.7]MCL1044735.1 type IV pilus biogenesis/stability protein PilW [Shewanella electrodiphila]MDO6613133.1 type IV pilus biogenesis/stability protein PilW [Shewanella sp. 7_MG-2023]MDO6773002.1 type IV pilus biogenesis/stability protein PilW [Shewanella sp. 2_MG-2023]MDO6796223.1 type IV pilus biogenesis/stability protein PilW [Shewanella sp.